MKVFNSIKHALLFFLISFSFFSFLQCTPEDDENLNNLKSETEEKSEKDSSNQDKSEDSEPSYDIDFDSFGSDDDFYNTITIDDTSDDDTLYYPQITVTSSSGESQSYSACTSSTVFPIENPCQEEGGKCSISVTACTDTGCEAESTVVIDTGDPKDPNSSSAEAELMKFYYQSEEEKIKVAKKIKNLSQAFKVNFPDIKQFDESEKEQVEKIYQTAESFPCTIVTEITTMGNIISANETKENIKDITSYDTSSQPFNLADVCDDDALNDINDDQNNPYIRYGHVLYLENQKGKDEENSRTFISVITDVDTNGCQGAEYCIANSSEIVSIADEENYDPKKLWQILPGKGKESTYQLGDTVKDSDLIRLKNLYYSSTLADEQKKEGTTDGSNLFSSDLGYTWLNIAGTGCQELKNEQDKRYCLSASKSKNQDSYSSTFKIRFGFNYDDKLKYSTTTSPDPEGLKYKDRLHFQSTFNPEDSSDDIDGSHFLDVQGSDCSGENLCVSSGYYDQSKIGNHLADLGKNRGNLLYDSFSDSKFRSSEWLAKSPCFATDEDLVTDGALAALWTSVIFTGALAVVGVVKLAIMVHKNSINAKNKLLLNQFEFQYQNFKSGRTGSLSVNFDAFLDHLKDNNFPDDKIFEMFMARKNIGSNPSERVTLEEAYLSRFGAPLQKTKKLEKALKEARANWKLSGGPDIENDINKIFGEFKKQAPERLGAKQVKTIEKLNENPFQQRAFMEFETKYRQTNMLKKPRLKLTNTTESTALAEFNLEIELYLSEFLGILSAQESAEFLTPPL